MTTIDLTEKERRDAAALVLQYLYEVHASEEALVTTLRAHIQMTPAGDYRDLLERHLGETRQQARSIERRLAELGGGRSLMAAGVGLAQTMMGQALALSKSPLDLLRGRGGEEKLLKNAKDECATEALEIASYDALETLAKAVGDGKTARLAARHRGQEEQMLERLRGQIPVLARALIQARIHGEPGYDLTETPAGESARRLAGRADRTVKEVKGKAKAGAV